MRILIAEDDFASRKFLQKLLSPYGECDIALDGLEAVEAFVLSNKMNTPYDLVCLDIMMPKLDGIKVLKTIRDLESQKGLPHQDAVKIVMISALNDKDVVFDSFKTGSEAYAVKPLNSKKFLDVLNKLGLIE